MNQRENLLHLYRRSGLHWHPCFFDLCPSLQEKYRILFPSGGPYEEYFDFPERFVEGIRVKEESHAQYYPRLAPGTQIDHWGVAREPGSPECAHMTYMRHPMEPFTRLEEFRTYPYPDFFHGSHGHIPLQVKAIQKAGYAAKANMGDTLWEIGWYLRGMEALMEDMLTQPALAAYHLDRITDISCHRARIFALAGVDILLTGDDVGMQQSLMMSEAMYVEWIKPRFSRIIQSAKEANPHMLIEYHSCGYVEPLIPHFIDAGIDILNPIQPECMDFASIHRKFGDRISFKGTIGIQYTMPFATPAEVRKTVMQNLDIAGPRGGLFCTPAHMLEPEVPWNNILAYVDACRDYRHG